MKISFKSAALMTLGLALSGTAFANDPIVGKWKMIEDGEAKVIMTVSQSGNTFSGKITEGLTKKAKKRVGKVVLNGVTAQGGGKYTGKGKHPTLPVPESDVQITVNGDSISIKSVIGERKGTRVK